MFLLIGVCILLCITFVAVMILEIVIAKYRNQNNTPREYIENGDVCDACGRHLKAPNSQICRECQRRAYDDSRDKG